MKSTRVFLLLLLLLLLLLPLFLVDTDGFGSMGPISAAFGDDAFFCAIDASGRQTVICWSTKKTALMAPSASSSLVNTIPPMAALSGGTGFLCGILANTSQAYCWTYAYPGKNLVPLAYRATAYSHIAAGKAHACGIRGSYYSDHDSGTVDCWEIILRSSNYTARSGGGSTLIYDQSISNLVFKKVVAGEGFSCGIVREGAIVCWGPNATSLGVSAISDSFAVLASGKGSLCGILDNSSMVKCWGDTVSAADLPSGVGFTSLTAGYSHFCGIRKDNHEVECWGTYNSSQIPKGSGFSAIASSDFSVCGIREVDLVLDCWFTGTSPIPSYDPPLELCSPGLCMARSCSGVEFAFNASILNEPDLSSLCLRGDLSICSPCGSNCSEGFFLSSPCTNNSDRVCSRCSLCQNTSCSTVCGLPLLQEMQQKHLREQRRLLLIAGCSASGFLILLICLCLITRSKTASVDAGAGKQFQFVSCVGKKESKERTNDDESIPALASVPSVGLAQIFRLVELKDATNGFKEFNEVGRGSYGFVYKAALPDGRLVAVKRANAATIIHTNSREYEMELEILCKLRHSNIVNLLGYCSEMGERILVYEFMQHGTLHDHLHGGLPPLNWTLRLKIAMQAAKGLEYLHKEVTPTMVHRDVKTLNILLDSDWVARIADFGLVISSKKDLNDDMKADIYSFGIVLLEILSGRKAYDIDYSPPDIVGWAAPQIKKGRGAAIIDRNVTLPRNVEPLLKLADMAELAVREDPNERPTISEISLWLEQIVKDWLVF